MVRAEAMCSDSCFVLRSPMNAVAPWGRVKQVLEYDDHELGELGLIFPYVLLIQLSDDSVLSYQPVL
jgi:hypothetical protein